MPKAKKSSDDQIMAALTRKVKSITAGESSPAPRGRDRKTSKTITRKTIPIDDALKTAIRKSGRSYYDLGRACGVSASVILRFMSDDPQARGGDMRLSTAAKVAAELGLELTGAREFRH